MTLEELNEASQELFVERHNTTPLRLNSAERLAFDAAQSDGFVTWPRRPNLGRAYRRWCWLTKVPCIKIYATDLPKSRNHRAVDLSMEPSGFDLNDLGVRAAAQVLKPHDQDPHGVYFDRVFCGCVRVPIDAAADLAWAFWRLATATENRTDHGKIPPLTEHQWRQFCKSQ